MNNARWGYLFMLLSATAFASMSVFMKRAYADGMTPWSFSVVQSFFALVQLLLMKLREPSPAVPRPRVSPVWLVLFALSGAVAAIAFNVALVTLSISLGTILLFTYPAFTALAAWGLLGERPTWLHGAALLLTLVGAALTVDLGGLAGGSGGLPGGQVAMVGVALALLSALGQGLYLALGDRIGGALSPVSATILTRGAIMLGSVVLYPAVLGEIITLPLRSILITLGASLVGGVAPFFFLYKGIALIGANRAAIVSVVELPIAIALGFLFEGEQILLLQWAGALLIGAAVVLSQHRPTPGSKE